MLSTDTKYTSFRHGILDSEVQCPRLKLTWVIIKIIQRMKQQPMITLRGMAEHRFSNNYFLNTKELFFASTVNDVRRKLHTVRTHSTVGKRAKRMPDITVETTQINIRFLIKRNIGNQQLNGLTYNSMV